MAHALLVELIGLLSRKNHRQFLRKQGGPKNPKARRHTAHLLWEILWCGKQRCARNRRKIFIETPGHIHHSMLRQLRLDSSIAISANVTLSRLFTRYLCLGAVPQKNHPEWAHAAANPCEKKRNIFVWNKIHQAAVRLQHMSKCSWQHACRDRRLLDCDHAQ